MLVLQKTEGALALYSNTPTGMLVVEMICPNFEADSAAALLRFSMEMVSWSISSMSSFLSLMGLLGSLRLRSYTRAVMGFATIREASTAPRMPSRRAATVHR